MNPLQKLIVFLDEAFNKGRDTSREKIAGYIVGEIIGDYDNIYSDLLENNIKVKRIADLASDLEWSNGSKDELNFMWQELKILIGELRNEQQIKS